MNVEDDAAVRHMKQAEDMLNLLPQAYQERFVAVLAQSSQVEGEQRLHQHGAAVVGAVRAMEHIIDELMVITEANRLENCEDAPRPPSAAHEAWKDFARK